MSRISQDLARKPNHFYASLEDADIKEFIVELGIGGKVPSFPASSNACVPIMHTQHPSHYLLIVRSSGYETAKDNGYELACFPKSKHGLNEFMEICIQAFQACGLKIKEFGVYWSGTGDNSS